MLVTGTETTTSFKAKASVLPEPLRINNPVVYYNFWTGWNESHLETTSTYFRQMTVKQLRNLKPGDLIWVNQDPLHVTGKVYGWVPLLVSRKEVNENEKTVKVYFSSGFTTVSLEPRTYRKVGHVKDLKALAMYAKEHPLCLNASSYA